MLSVSLPVFLAHVMHAERARTSDRCALCAEHGAVTVLSQSALRTPGTPRVFVTA